MSADHNQTYVFETYDLMTRIVKHVDKTRRDNTEILTKVVDRLNETDDRVKRWVDRLNETDDRVKQWVERMELNEARDRMRAKKIAELKRRLKKVEILVPILIASAEDDDSDEYSDSVFLSDRVLTKKK